MPEEIEVPLEQVQEHIHEAHHAYEAAAQDAPAEHAAKYAPEASDRHSWVRFVALGTAILAVVAAVGALQSGLLVNEALLQKNEQVGRLTQASDTWTYYQAEGLKSLIYKTAAQGLTSASAAAQEDRAQSAHYLSKQAQLQQKAEQLETQAEQANRAAGHYLARHHVFAYSVSFCQIAIALSAIAALTRHKRVWLTGLAAGAVGIALLLYGFLTA